MVPAMDLNTLQKQMISLYNETMGYKFQKKTYESDFEKLRGKYSELLEEIAELCRAEEEFPEQIISCIPEYVSGRIGSLQSKRKRNMASFDHNLNMVAYFIPLIGKAPSDRAGELTGKIVSLWNRKMPENKIGHSTYESICGGFRDRICYITTAVCRSLSKPDDCYELTLLRKYRDGYLLESPEGEALVREYYNIAPTIVKRIDKCRNADQIYQNICQDYLKPCIRLIEEQRLEECGEVYSRMVRRLGTEYLYS